ncbi:NAD(P)/FAD-dependent oxidoreductase [Evansella sp. AB-rgal1]|uniref:NAD(P)/FAD-dependent oxidoreductase n=1 Tax=Evansella sp. AB-rgal1 TaxID=3242696 RepID=UPI00359DE7B9
MKNYTVVGAGILGATVAYYLAKAGVKVTIIDRKDLGQATDAAAGIICPWLSQRRNKAWYTLAKNGARFYPTLIKQLEEDGERNTGYKQVGAISLHTDANKLAKMEGRALKRREDALEIGNIVTLSAEKTKEKFPLLSEEFGSVYVSGGARVNGRALRQALISAAVKHGATFIQGGASLVVDGNEVVGVKVDGEHIPSYRVIITAGAWANEILKPLGISFLVKPQKAQIVHLKIDDVQTNEWPVVMPPNNQYLLSIGDGKIVIGATHEDDMGFDNRITIGGVHEILDKALKVAPGLCDATFVETRVGFRPVTPGFLPVFGKIPNVKGLYAANGLGASGLTVGPFLGSEVGKLLLNEETSIDKSDYDIAGAIEYL